MNKFRFTLTALAIMAFTLMVSSAAQAQATRTWVSGVGDDVNPCSRTAPCKTFAGAISKTATGGEISVLDPGGFGAINITKSITINGTNGAGYGSILAAGTNGVIVNSATANVRLRRLDINGVGTGINGIRIIAALKVTVEDCAIDGFTNRGITDDRTTANGQLFITDTTVRNTTQSSIGITPGVGGSITAAIDNVRTTQSGNTGFVVVGNAKATIRNSFATFNATGFFSDGAGSEMNIINCLSAHNSNLGVSASGGTVIRLSDSTIVNNTNASINAAGQTLVSSTGTNTIAGNGANNLPTGPGISQN
jgi:hypothetical protein